jgi:hypothetical protein
MSCDSRWDRDWRLRVGIEYYLAIIESAFNSEVVNVRIGYCSHLRLLDRRDAPFWVEDEYRDVGLISQTIDGSTEDRLVSIRIPRVFGLRAYLPVSPLVAPTTVNFSVFSPGAFLAFRRSRKNPNRFPSSCSATSLNANVGPWNSSSTNVFSSSFFSGVISGCRKLLYDFSTRDRSSSREISDGDMYRDSTATERSTME